MKMVNHHIDLHGPGCEGRYARPEVVGGVLSRIAPMAVQAVRMSVLHASRRVGRPVKGLSRTWSLLHGPQEKGPDGGTRLTFRAPTLGEAAPELFRQGRLWEEGPSPEETAFDLIGAMIRDILEEKRESERYDTDLLERVAGFAGAMKHGLECLVIGGHHLEVGPPRRIDPGLTARAREWISATPPPRRVRVSGRLDMIRVSDRAFELILGTGQRLRAVWIESALAPLRDYLDQSVLIEGNAVYRPSGGLLRVDAEAIRPATDADAYFTRMPGPGGAVRAERLRIPQTAATGINAIWGQWRDEQSEADLLRTLEELS